MLRNELYKPWFAGDEKVWGFEILEGEFKDTVIQIDKLEIAESEEGNMNVEYNVINKPEVVSDDDIKGELFKTVFTTIIEDIIREAVKTYEQDRNDNPEESSKWWRIYA